MLLFPNTLDAQSRSGQNVALIIAKILLLAQTMLSPLLRLFRIIWPKRHPDDPMGKWIPLARLTSPQEAEMVKGALKAKGFPAEILSTTGHFGQIGMGYSSYSPMGAFTVMVPKEYLDDAYHVAEIILGEIWDDVRLIDLDEDSPSSPI